MWSSAIHLFKIFCKWKYNLYNLFGAQYSLIRTHGILTSPKMQSCHQVYRNMHRMRMDRNTKPCALQTNQILNWMLIWLIWSWFDSLTTFEVPFIFIIRLMFKVAIIFHRSNPTIPFFSFNLSSSAHREFFNFQAYFFKSYRRWAKSRGINFLFSP